MATGLKKILVIFPVLLLTVFFLHDHYARDYAHTSKWRIILFSFTLLLLYAWMFYDLVNKETGSLVYIGINSSFYVYIFMVLTLTGYFILYREVSMHEWWHKMILRIERRDRVNFELFKVFKIYRITNRQVLGNLVMLFPLGIYLPLLYNRMSGFFKVIFICMLFSVSIELLQLITSFRSTDIDDVFLNTTGAAFGYFTYMVFSNFFKSSKPLHKDEMEIVMEPL
ncbi:MAG TPA: VanZ family protein [Flavisolibacter sp.]|nr:VanZ family protein [Flavisolibacter sp.]